MARYEISAAAEEGWKKMSTIRVGDNENLEIALRRFKRVKEAEINQKTVTQRYGFFLQKMSKSRAEHAL